MNNLNFKYKKKNRIDDFFPKQEMNPLLGSDIESVTSFKKCKRKDEDFHSNENNLFSFGTEIKNQNL